MNGKSLLPVLAFTLMISAVQAASVGTLVELPSLHPNPYPNANGLAISGNGTVAVGYSTASNREIHAVAWISSDWTNPGSVQLVDLHPGPDWEQSNALDVSADGKIIIGTIRERNGPVSPVVWVVGDWNDPSSIQRSDLRNVIGTQSFIKALSPDGTAIAGNPNNTSPAFVLRSDDWLDHNAITVENIATLGGPSIEAEAVTDAGNAVVGYSDILPGNYTDSIGFVYQNGSLRGLGVNGPASVTQVADVNWNGKLIVGGAGSTTGTRVVLWRNGLPTELEHGPAASAFPFAVNSCGNIMAGRRNGPGEAEAVYWHGSQHEVVHPSGWFHSRLQDVSDQGIAIGTGQKNAGQDSVAFVVVTGNGFNPAPLAFAEVEGRASTGHSLLLGSGESCDETDPGWRLKYRWSITDKPTGSQALVDQPTSPSTQFIPDIAGVYVISLQVTDSAGNTSTHDYPLQVTQ